MKIHSMGVELEILNIDTEALVTDGGKGEICVRGPSITSGYLDNDVANQKAFTKDGFFRTGNEGVQVSDGSMQITGRLKKLINKVSLSYRSRACKVAVHLKLSQRI